MYASMMFAVTMCRGTFSKIGGDESRLCVHYNQIATEIKVTCNTI